MGWFVTFIFMNWGEISPFMCFQKKCPDFLLKMSGILDPRIPPFRRSAHMYVTYVCSHNNSHECFSRNWLLIFILHNLQSYGYLSNIEFACKNMKITMFQEWKTLCFQFKFNKSVKIFSFAQCILTLFNILKLI